MEHDVSAFLVWGEETDGSAALAFSASPATCRVGCEMTTRTRPRGWPAHGREVGPFGASRLFLSLLQISRL
jgi:hypothetical protein